MMTNLKTCPFCGGRALVHKTTSTSDYPGIFVMCTKCLTSSDNYPNDEAAVEHWNRRVNDDGA